jgi:hypothetical protein
MIFFKDLNDNFQYKDESNNCVVVALTEVTSDDFDYETIKFFVRHVMNRTKNNSVIYGEILKSKNFFTNIGLKYKKIKIKENEIIRDFVKKNNKGKFLLITENHMLALKEGCIHDFLFDIDKKLICAIKVD